MHRIECHNRPRCRSDQLTAEYSGAGTLMRRFGNNECGIYAEVTEGGSIAVGHPFAATGTRIVGTLAKLLASNPNAKRGLISACTAGGMGVPAIVER